MSRLGYRYSRKQGSCPVFDDAEINPAAFLTYFENMLADIHGNDSGAHCEVMYFISV